MITNFEFKENNYDIDFFVELIVTELKDYKVNTFNLGVSYPNSIDEDQKLILKKDFQFFLTKKIEEKLKATRRDEFGDVDIIIDYNYHKITYHIHPIYIYGAYNKYSRNLPQTIHYCFKCKGRGCANCNNLGKLSSTSVEEKLQEVIFKELNIKEIAFHGAGREDKDVLMLGNGREFIIELKKPFIREIDNKKLKDLEKIINKDKEIKVSNLRLAEVSEVKKIKETNHFKLYKATVVCEDKITEEKLSKIKLNTEIEISQETPTRVKKRRANLVRKRLAEIENIIPLTDNSFSIEIKAEAGLYIKEFISGDNNLTKPNISKILEIACECKKLDVIWIYRE